MGFFKKLIKGVAKVGKALVKGVGSVLGLGSGEKSAKVTVQLPPGMTSQSVGVNSVIPGINGPVTLSTGGSWLKENWWVLLLIVSGVGLVILLVVLLTKKKR